jgi:hypothetical protein
MPDRRPWGRSVGHPGEDAYDALVEPEITDLVSRPFEDLCCSAFRALYPEHTVTEAGRWWDGEHEIDVVELTTAETLIVGECKFQQSPLTDDAFSKRQRHADELY